MPATTAIPDTRTPGLAPIETPTTAPDEIERGREHQPEPQREPDDGARERPEPAGDEVVPAAAFRHGGRQLGGRQRDQQRDDAADPERDRRRRPDRRAGQSREHEDPGPDHRPDADREAAGEPEGPFELRVLGDRRLVRFDDWLRDRRLTVGVRPRRLGAHTDRQRNGVRNTCRRASHGGPAGRCGSNPRRRSGRAGGTRPRVLPAVVPGTRARVRSRASITFPRRPPPDGPARRVRP